MPAGRHRTFDEKHALEAAMRVFWQKGYAGASLTDLTQAMGINKPSMYAAFGNKEQLFIASLQNYLNAYASTHADCLKQNNQTFRARLRGYLMSIIHGQCGATAPKGCFISVSISESISDDFPVAAKAQIDAMKSVGEGVLLDFFTAAQANGELADDHDVTALAQYYMGVMHGTAALARAGKSRQELTTVVETALKVL